MTKSLIQPPSPVSVPSGIPAYIPDWSASLPDRRMTTPRLLKALVIVVTLAAIATWSVGTAIIADVRAGIQTIGRDAVPSVIAAQEIRAHLANMNAQAANAMLTGGATAQKAWKDYETERAAVSDKLITAAQNITYGDAERRPIVEIAAGVQRYAELIGQVRGVVPLDPHVATPDQAVIALRAATTLLNDQLLPAADRLNDANAAVIEKTWAARKKASSAEVLALVALGLPVIIVLGAAQRALMQRSRRRLNPLLLLATLAVFGCALYLGGAASHVAAQLRSAKEDAFDSVNALWRARSTAYAANADESLFLADPALKVQYAQVFRAKMSLIAAIELDRPAAIQAVIDASAELARRNCPAGAVDIKGYLGDELRNVTYPGECAAATAALRTLADYDVIDAKIRALEGAGRREEAIALDVGVKQGDSNWAFDRFDQSLDALIGINKRAFDTSVDTCFATLAPLEWVLSLECLALILLTWLGIRPRLAEYRD